MKHSEKDAIKNVSNYIINKASGVNKQESALLAGYSESTAKVPNRIEHTKTYLSIVDQVLTENANIMLFLSASLSNDIADGKLDGLKPIEKAQIYKIITDTNDKLTPKVTVKEVQNKDGTVTRTAWGTNSSQLNETLRSEQ